MSRMFPGRRAPKVETCTAREECYSYVARRTLLAVGNVADGACRSWDDVRSQQQEIIQEVCRGEDRENLYAGPVSGVREQQRMGRR